VLNITLKQIYEAWKAMTKHKTARR